VEVDFLSLSVQEGLAGDTWVCGIAGVLSVDATVQFLKLWEVVHRVAPSGEADVFCWKWSDAGVFSAHTAYQAFFIGPTTLPGSGAAVECFRTSSFQDFWMAGLARKMLVGGSHGSTWPHLPLDLPALRD
jgi:hypothetical protein